MFVAASPHGRVLVEEHTRHGIQGKVYFTVPGRTVLGAKRCICFDNFRIVIWNHNYT